MTFDRKSYMKEYHKKWYQDNKDRLKDKMKVNHTNNKERDIKRSNDWYQENKDLTIDRAKISYRKDKNRKRDTNLKRSYGISLESYNQMFELQQGQCAICGIHQTGLSTHLSVDHNHTTGQVRGLLCHKCNFALGNLNDNIELFRNAISYLEKYK